MICSCVSGVSRQEAGIKRINIIKDYSHKVHISSNKKDYYLQSAKQSVHWLHKASFT